MENARELAQCIARAEKEHPETTLFLCAGYALIGQEWRTIPYSSDLIHLHKQAEEELARLLAANASKALVLIRRPQAAAFVLIRAGKKEGIPVENDHLCLPQGQCFHVLDMEDYTETQPCVCKTCLPVSSVFATRKTDILLVLGNLKFAEGQEAALRETLHTLSSTRGVPLIFLNPSHATDGLVYAGSSRILSKDAQLLALCKHFGEDVTKPLATPFAPFNAGDVSAEFGIQQYPASDEKALLFEAATLAIRQYVKNCGVKHIVLGLSGGMDSSLVACMAVEAIGAQSVSGVLMPSPFTSAESTQDAEQLARHLGITTYTCPIGENMEALKTVLPFPVDGLTGENIQPRLRGLILMAFANHLSGIALATGNKSELAMGYSTLYGDTVGALAPLGDIYKTRVYEIARWYNKEKNQSVIPERVFSKAPTAELRHNQKDEDSLPPYPVLDALLQKLFSPLENFSPCLLSPSLQERVALKELPLVPEDNRPVLAQALTPEKEHDVLRRLTKSQFKRRQSPPVVRLSKTCLTDIFTAPISAEYPKYPSQP